MEIELWIAGEARGKARPRFNTKTGSTYKVKKDDNAEANVIAVWREGGERRIEEFTEREIVLGDRVWTVDRVQQAVKLDILIMLRRPGSHYNSKGELNTNGYRHPLPENKKPDVDNAVKLIMDALNKRAYTDDVRVTDARQRRRWSRSREGIIVTITEDKDWGDLP